MRKKNVNCERLETRATLIATSILIAGSQAGFAAGETRFREFRDLNPGLNRHEARQVFRSEVRNARGLLQAGGQQTQYPIIDPKIPHCIVEVPKVRRDNAGWKSALPERVRGQSMQFSNASQMIRLASGVDLDLTSDVRNITLGKNLFRDQAAVEIAAGGQTKSLGAGSQVSAAEYVAVKQILCGGNQRITVNKSGVATGGEVDLDAITGNNDVMRARSLVVSKNVTTYGDFGKGSDFKLLGDLNNYGTVHATSTDNKVNAGAIRADDINNFRGATISSDVDLALDASGNLSNDGTIASAGSLTLSAGGAVSNNGSISSQHDLNVVSSQINNHGSLQSTAGNVTFDSPAALHIDNSKGTISALNGAINLRNASYADQFDTTVSGGDLLSREVNLNAGSGLVDVKVGELTGVVNGTGDSAHVLAQTEVLNLGLICLTGDPTFYNTQGSVSIASTLAFTQDLVIVAAGDITSASNIDASTPTGSFNVTLIAGAAFDPQGGADSPSIPPGNAGGVELSGKKSKTGGSIILNGQILTDGAGAGFDAGDITLVAFAGKNTGSGRVDIANANLRAGGGVGAFDGDVTILASSKESGAAILVGTVDTVGGSSPSGDVTIAVGPIGTTDGPVAYDANGSLIGSSLLTVSRLNKNGDVVVSSFGSGIQADNVSITSGQDINIESGVTAQQNIDLTANGNVTVNTMQAGGNVSVTIKGELETGGQLIANLLSVFKAQALNLDAQISFLDISPDAGVENAFVRVNTVSNVEVLQASAKEQLDIDAQAGTTLTTTGLLSANNMSLKGDAFVSLGDITAKESLTLDAVFLNSSSFNGEIKVPRLVLNGSQIAAEIPTSVKLLEVDSFGPATIVLNNSKEVTMDNCEVGDLTVTATNSVTLHDIISLEAVSVTLQNGTLTVAGSGLQANDGPITLVVNQTATKGKIVIEPNVFMEALDNFGGNFVSISVGPPDATIFTPDPNVFDLNEANGGIITFTGAGAQGKPVVVITAGGDTSQISIRNGTGKIGNISIGSGVIIQTNDSF